MAAWDEPIVFFPLAVSRVWGGRRLEERFGKDLPAGEAIGELWEVVDRPEAQSAITSGAPAGWDLHRLWTEHRGEVFGKRGLGSDAKRFPLLVKLLDAREALSVQVHPPAHLASALGGEPKNEAWLLLDAEPGTHLYAGLAAGVTRASFADRLESGADVSALLHRLPVAAGDVLFLPSGRVHAIGAGCLIAEVQQNSDTTYRVFDYNRLGLDGRPRGLHVSQALACIDWDDVEPELLRGEQARRIATSHFEMERRALRAGQHEPAAPEGECAIVGVLEGSVTCRERTFTAGDFFLTPPSAGLELSAQTDQAEVLRVLLPVPTLG